MSCVLSQAPVAVKPVAKVEKHKTCSERLGLVKKLQGDCEAEMKKMTPRKLQSVVVKKPENDNKKCNVELDKVFMQALMCNKKLITALKKKASACGKKPRVHVRVHVKGKHAKKEQKKKAKKDVKKVAKEVKEVAHKVKRDPKVTGKVKAAVAKIEKKVKKDRKDEKKA